MKKNLDNMHKPFVPRVQCLKKNSPSYGKMAINIIGTLDEDLSEDFQRIEWLLAMDETNFLKNWDEKWTDLKA